MYYLNPFLISGGVLSASLVFNLPIKAQEKTSPNIIIILTDDLGYGDIGCFGAEDIKTPNIDRMAAEGIKFSEFYCPAPYSSPSRAGLLTGRYPIRMGVNSVFFPESFTGMPQSEITIAEMLKTKGYSTGIFGKWHLGHHREFLPINQGFDHYFGIPYSNDMSGQVYMRDTIVEEFNPDQHYITKRYTEESIKFIQEHKKNPFFLYMCHNMPHVPIYASEKFMGTSKRGLYGDVIQEIDWSVGEILAELEQQGILENTFVIFTSDNGPWHNQYELGGSAGILREGKGTTYEGGQRVPTVAMWKTKIKAGTNYDNMVSMLDLFPTFANICGSNMAKDRVYDGIDITKVLTGQGIRNGNEFVYIYSNKFEAYRLGDWKYKKAFAGQTDDYNKRYMPAQGELLVNIKQDPSEKNNLAETFPDIMKMLKVKLDSMEKSMQALPASLIMQMPADVSHINYLKERYKNLHKTE